MVRVGIVMGILPVKLDLSLDLSLLLGITGKRRQGSQSPTL